TRPRGERARDLDPAALPPQKAERGRLAQVRDRQVLEQRIEAIGDLVGVDALQLENRLHVLADRELAENRRLLRQIRQSQGGAGGLGFAGTTGDLPSFPALSSLGCGCKMPCTRAPSGDSPAAAGRLSGRPSALKNSVSALYEI